MSVFLKVVSVSQRGKKNRCVGIGLCFKGTEKAERKARLTVGEDKVFGDDFADVDLREELCYHSRPKKQFGGLIWKTIHKERPTGFYSAGLLLCLIDLFYWG